MDPNIPTQPGQSESPVAQPNLQQRVNEVSHSKSKFKLILLILILLIITCGGAYLLGAKQNVFLSQDQQKPTPTIARTSSTGDNRGSYWAKYENKELGFALEYPTFISDGKEAVRVDTYEDKKNNMVYIGKQNKIRDFLSGQAMYMAPASVLMQRVDNDKELEESVKKYGSDCKIVRKSEEGRIFDKVGIYREIIVDYSTHPGEEMPDCAISDAHYKIYYAEKNGDKRVISWIISAQDCFFPDPDYEKNSICYDILMLDHLKVNY